MELGRLSTYRHVLAKNVYPLVQANQKHGFGDGDDLPNLGHEYDSYVWETIAAKLDQIGLTAKPINYGTSHNRIRFDEFVLRPGQTVSECWSIFRQHQAEPIQFWAYNDDSAGLAAVAQD